jgi:hypothetical protein
MQFYIHITWSLELSNDATVEFAFTILISIFIYTYRRSQANMALIIAFGLTGNSFPFFNEELVYWNFLISCNIRWPIFRILYSCECGGGGGGGVYKTLVYNEQFGCGWWDEKLWSWVSRGPKPRMTVLSKTSSNLPDRRNIADEWLPQLFYISEVLASILGLEAGYSDKFVRISSVPPDKCKFMAVHLHVPSNSLFTTLYV